MLKIRVLGSAAGGGFPQWNCNCKMCHGQRTGSISAKARTQSSIAVTSNDTDWLLFNTSPDILTQLKATPELQPARGVRDTGIASIFLLDAQIDHTTGLLMLREHAEPLSLWCTEPVKEDLSTGNPLFNVLSHYAGTQWNRVKPGERYDSIPGAQGITIDVLALRSNAPPYSPRRDQPVPGDTVGVLMTDQTSGRSVFYAPGLGEIEPHVWDVMQNADILLIDGTMWTDDEMQQAGISARTARAMGHLPQSGDDGMLQWLEKLPDTTRKILIHINNTNPILDENSAESAELSNRNIEVAYDGMLIDSAL